MLALRTLLVRRAFFFFKAFYPADHEAHQWAMMADRAFGRSASGARFELNVLLVRDRSRRRHSASG
ncbi:MAG: hypothetical protein AAF959_20960 [Cyanobacteria bacterium P01_D01_bin.56]